MAADFNFVTTRLATGGGLATVSDAQEIQAAGITHVVDCRAELDDAPLLAGLGLSYLWLPTADDAQQKPDDWFARGIDFGLAALRVPRARLLYHCAAGVNRGPSAAYALLRALGLHAALAEGLLRAARPQVGLAYARQADAFVAKMYE